MFRVFRVFGWLVLAACAVAQAQTVPDAGSLLMQMERGRVGVLPKPVAPEVAAPPQPMQALPGARQITVKSFVFAGNTLLASEQLASAVAPFLDRPLDFSELKKAAVAVAEAYRREGWVVRSYLPSQDITEGIVTIQIVEAVFGGVHFEGREPRRIARETVRRIITQQQPKGAALNADAIDRALLLAQDLPGVLVVGSLGEGKASGETALSVKVTDKLIVLGDASIDNTGSRSTGVERANGNVTIASLRGWGEQLTANLTNTQGSNYARLGLTFPLGYDGWRIGLNASAMRYKLVAPEFLALMGHGSSSTQGLEASYPLVRSRMQNVYLAFNVDRKRFDNESGGLTTTHYQIDTFSAALNTNRIDKVGGGGSNNASVTLVCGRVDLDDSPNAQADAQTTRTAGNYTKLRYAVSRQQVISDTVSFSASLSGQVASKNLDSSEKFYLGGPSGVRAYPASEAGGSEGQLLNLELRTRLPANFNLSGFYDWGQVQVNRDNNYTGAAARNELLLSGLGLALAWQGNSGANAKLTWARRIGSNPNPTSIGNDQDGTLVENRFWLTASLPF